MVLKMKRNTTFEMEAGDKVLIDGFKAEVKTTSEFTSTFYVWHRPDAYYGSNFYFDAEYDIWRETDYVPETAICPYCEEETSKISVNEDGTVQGECSSCGARGPKIKNGGNNEVLRVFANPEHAQYIPNMG
jgi:Zn ribbon nucleic-acid-binding protein